MKKEMQIILIAVVILLLVYQINAQAITGSTVTGSTVTGEVTSAGASLSITITGPPTLILDSPKNDTYVMDKNLDLKFIVRSADLIWYNLDDGGNITVTGNTTFNTTLPSHIIYLFANNTYGLTSKNVIFSINKTKFFIDYSDYKDKGFSTDFNKSGFEELQNLSGIILELPDFGKISFNESINVTDDAYPGDNFVDIDSHVKISFNRTEINTTAMPNFNKSATLSLYNLTFLNPRILKDGEVCPDTICTEIDYSGGTLVFNVTSFSVYSAEETPEEPSEEEPTPPSVVGRGGIDRTKSFSVNINEILVHLKQGEVATKNIVITNNKIKKLNIKIELQRLGDFLLIRDSEFNLNPGESKTISLDFIARVTDIPELYLGKIIIKGDDIEEEILVMLEIESKDILLDVYAEIPSVSKRLLRGEDLLAEIRILNLGAFRGARDIRIEYKIRDLDGNDIFEEHETIAIETQTSFIKKIHVPEYLEYGEYILYIRAIYNGEVASASARFEVAKSKATLFEKVFIVAIIFLIIIIGFLVYYIITHPRGIIKYLEKRRFKIKKRAGFKDIKK